MMSHEDEQSQQAEQLQQAEAVKAKLNEVFQILPDKVAKGIRGSFNTITGLVSLILSNDTYGDISKIKLQLVDKRHWPNHESRLGYGQWKDFLTPELFNKFTGKVEQADSQEQLAAAVEELLQGVVDIAQEKLSLLKTDLYQEVFGVNRKEVKLYLGVPYVMRSLAKDHPIVLAYLYSELKQYGTFEDIT